MKNFANRCRSFIGIFFFFASFGLCCLPCNAESPAFNPPTSLPATKPQPWQFDGQSDFLRIPPYDDLNYPTELEGFSMIDNEYCVLVCSAR